MLEPVKMHGGICECLLSGGASQCLTRLGRRWGDTLDTPPHHSLGLGWTLDHSFPSVPRKQPLCFIRCGRLFTLVRTFATVLTASLGEGCFVSLPLQVELCPTDRRAWWVPSNLPGSPRLRMKEDDGPPCRAPMALAGWLGAWGSNDCSAHVLL